jgi:hypothetical protein
VVSRFTKIPLNPRLFFKVAANLGGLLTVLSEILRNAFFHGSAANVYIDILHEADPRLKAIQFLDDGVGMNVDARFSFGESLGNTTSTGTGNGARLSAVTLCQIMECLTVSADESDVAYRIVLPLPKFLIGIAEGTWEPTWERTPRAQSGFPAELTSGTLITLRDFRASDADAPLDEDRMRNKARLVTEERVRTMVPRVLQPNLARRVIVNGGRVRPPEIDGVKLWDLRPREIPGLGVVCGDVRLAPDVEGRWCMIGGANATVPLRTFLEDASQHAPHLASRLPSLLSDRRLTGYIQLGVLEHWPTQSREHLDPAFYDDESASVVVEYLATVVCPAVQTRVDEIASQPPTEATRMGIARVAARINQAQGMEPGSVPGSGDGEGCITLPALALNRVTIVLEVTSPGEEPDRSAFVVRNPLPDETFSWDDYGACLIAVRDAKGTRVEVESRSDVGVRQLTVQSDQHPERMRHVNVDIRTPRESVDGDAFLLKPMTAHIFVGDEKKISVRSQGPSSGQYRWIVERIDDDGRTVVTGLTERPGGRQVVFVPDFRGDYEVRCEDLRYPDLSATCTVEVLEPVAVAEPPAPDTPNSGGEGYGGDGQRPSVYDREMIVVFDDVQYRLRGAPHLSEPWSMQLPERIILISDIHPMNTNARTMSERDAFIVWCLANAIALHQVSEFTLASDDFMGIAGVHDRVLREGFEDIA